MRSCCCICYMIVLLCFIGTERCCGTQGFVCAWCGGGVLFFLFDATAMHVLAHRGVVSHTRAHTTSGTTTYRQFTTGAGLVVFCCSLRLCLLPVTTSAWRKSAGGRCTHRTHRHRPLGDGHRRGGLVESLVEAWEAPPALLNAPARSRGPWLPS